MVLCDLFLIDNKIPTEASKEDSKRPSVPPICQRGWGYLKATRTSNNGREEVKTTFGYKYEDEDIGKRPERNKTHW